MTVTCRACAATIPEDDAYPVLASGTPAWVCSPACGVHVAATTSTYANRLDDEAGNAVTPRRIWVDVP